jgi:hypothetical protein
VRKRIKNNFNPDTCGIVGCKTHVHLYYYDIPLCYKHWVDLCDEKIILNFAPKIGEKKIPEEVD